MDDGKVKYQIGANIAAYRKRDGLTQATLAEKLNYSDKAVSKWERGESVPDVVKAPGICQLPLTLECKVIYKQQQDLTRVPQEILDRFYPALDETGFRDYHIAYYGEIVNAYLIQE